LRLGTSLEDRPRYTPSTTFETFPFPEGMTPNLNPVDYVSSPLVGAIASAAQQLSMLRQNWLYPANLIELESEVLPGYPDRLLPKNRKAADELRGRTLTRLYNEYPSWLEDAHRKVDDAVAEAYGWPTSISNDEAVNSLLELNLARAPAPAGSVSASAET